MSKTEFDVFCPECNMLIAAKVVAEGNGGVTAHPRHWQVHWAASTELPARQARMAAKALKPRSIPVSMTEQIAA